MRWSLGTTLSFALLAAPVAGAQQRSRTDTIPREHYPPAGMCRIWLNGVPAERQPAPTDCATAVRNRPTNGRVIFGNDAPRAGKTPGKAAFRAGSVIGGTCVDRDKDGVCDETWARPTERLRPLPETGSGSAVNERPAPRREREPVVPPPARQPEKEPAKDPR